MELAFTSSSIITLTNYLHVLYSIFWIHRSKTKKKLQVVPNLESKLISFMSGTVYHLPNYLQKKIVLQQPQLVAQHWAHTKRKMNWNQLSFLDLLQRQYHHNYQQPIILVLGFKKLHHIQLVTIFFLNSVSKFFIKWLLQFKNSTIHLIKYFFYSFTIIARIWPFCFLSGRGIWFVLWKYGFL